MPPPLSSHSPRAQRLIKKLNTPTKVQRWLRTLKYNPKETMRTLDQFIRHGEAHCLEAALAAATILEYHGPAQHRSGTTGDGYPPLILDLESTDLLDHTLFLYQQNGRFGTIGMSRDIGLHGRKPVFKTIIQLVQSYAAPYIDEKACLTRYGTLDLRTLKRISWRTSTKNVWAVENALRHIPHHPLRLSPKFIDYWRRRYINFRRLHPHQQPTFYPDQQHWA